jgi:uridine kinase
MATDAFLSYNDKDSRFARELYEKLTSLGVSVWFAEEHMDYSVPFQLTTAKAISDAHFFVLLVGAHRIGEEQTKEIGLADDLRRKGKIGFIPTLIPGYDELNTDPYTTYIIKPFTRRDLTNGLDEANEVYALASSIKHDIIPAPAPEVIEPIPIEQTGLKVLTVSGGSGARTGTLCGILADHYRKTLGEQACKILSMERYYVGSVKTRAEVGTNRYGDANFDDPEIIDFDQIVKDVEQLRAGRSIQIPEYDKKAHATTTFEPIEPPSHLVFLEGSYLLQNSKIRGISDATIYVSVDPEVRFINRIRKDFHHFKIPLRHALNYYFRAVKPAFDRWVDPFKNNAKLALPVKVNYESLDFHNYRDPIDYSAATHQLIRFLKKERLV